MIDGGNDNIYGNGGFWLWLMVVIPMVFMVVVVVMFAVVLDDGIGAYSGGVGGYGGGLTLTFQAEPDQSNPCSQHPNS